MISAFMSNQIYRILACELIILDFLMVTNAVETVGKKRMDRQSEFDGRGPEKSRNNRIGRDVMTRDIRFRA